MNIYTFDSTIDGTRSKVIKAWIPAGACVVTTQDDLSVLWVASAKYVRIAAEGIESVEAGVGLEDLTVAKLKALCAGLDLAQSGTKAALIARLEAALEES